MKGKGAISRASLDSERRFEIINQAKGQNPQVSKMESMGADQDEEVMVGKMGGEVYRYWIQAAGPLAFICFVASSFFYQTCVSGAHLVLQAWASNGSVGERNSFFIGLIAIISLTGELEWRDVGMRKFR